MFEDKTYESLKNDILNNYNLDIAKNEGSFLDEIASFSCSFKRFLPINRTESPIS